MMFVAYPDLISKVKFNIAFTLTFGSEALPYVPQQCVVREGLVIRTVAAWSSLPQQPACRAR